MDLTVLGSREYKVCLLRTAAVEGVQDVVTSIHFTFDRQQQQQQQQQQR